MMLKSVLVATSEATSEAEPEDRGGDAHGGHHLVVVHRHLRNTDCFRLDDRRKTHERVLWMISTPTYFRQLNTADCRHENL